MENTERHSNDRATVTEDSVTVTVEVGDKTVETAKIQRHGEDHIAVVTAGETRVLVFTDEDGDIDIFVEEIHNRTRVFGPEDDADSCAVLDPTTKSVLPRPLLKAAGVI